MIGVAASAANVTRITIINNSYPDPSPDGARIAFQSDRTGTPQIYVMNADGTDIRRLADDEHGAETPVWSKNGSAVYAKQAQEGDGYEFGDVVRIALAP